MLQQLDIHNIALIENISVEFDKGFNILTGETGAGKSIIIDSINAILGERMSKDIIRTNTDRALVEAVFRLDNPRLDDIFENSGIVPEDDGTVIISREFTASGKNICRVNGKLVTVSTLKQIGERIIDIHGQHDNQSLLRTENHLELLDSFGGEGIQQIKREYAGLLADLKDVRYSIKGLSGDDGERNRKIELLRYQIDEIIKAKLKTGEEEELEKKRLILSNAGKILNSLSSAREYLASDSSMKASASDLINKSISELNAIARLGDAYAKLSDRLTDISYQLEDVIRDIRHEKDSMEFNPALLEQLEERADLIYRLKRKYRNNIEGILDYCKDMERELDSIIKSEETLRELRKKEKGIFDRLWETAKNLHEERIRVSKILEEQIGGELEDLEMRKARFKVQIDYPDGPNPDIGLRLGESGLDRVEFLISPNAGEPLKPLSKIASGGEMSRIMLAIKAILANVDNVPTLIFDEIDMGVSGKVSQRIGEKLSFVSKNHQVICVTHLPQIACMADSHFLIEKTTEENNTRTGIRKLDGEGVKDEIARMLGGAVISEITRKHAEEMLAIAGKLKKEQ